MSFPRYEAYKDSGVEWLGQIPTHWTVEELKYACTNRPSNVDKKAIEGEQTVLLCNYTDVYYNELITSKMELMRATATDEQIERFTLKSGDVIITKDSETADDIAVSAYVPKDMPGVVCGYHLAMLRPHDGVSGKFIKRLFDSVYIRSKVATLANGLTRVGLSSGAIGGLELPIPPASEQHAIALFLDRETSKIDALVSEQRRLVELLKEKRQAVISHAVTKGLDPTIPMKPSGIEWLGDVPAHWEVQRVKAVTSFVTSGPRGWSERIAETGALFIQSGDLDDKLNINFEGCNRVQVENDAEAARTQLLEGDVVICVTGAKTGNVAICKFCPEVAYVNQHVCLIRPTQKMNSSYLGIQLKSDLGQTYFAVSQYGLKQGLSLENVKDAPVVRPPLREQVKIVDFVLAENDKFNSLVTEAERASVLLQERRTALISAAVTGKIDVRDFALTGVQP